MSPPTDERVMVNDRWPLLLPHHRAARESWFWWEAQRLAAMFHHIGPGDVVYDIGAEEGDFPALWATWGAEVVLVEPNPHVWPCIRHIWEANELPAPLGWFVGFCSERTITPPEVDTNAEPTDGWPACAYGPLIGDHGFRHLAEHEGSTPQVTLDELVERTGKPPTVLTMDVEGAEEFVLTGAYDTLAHHRPVVFVSIHPEFMADLYGLANGVERIRALMAGHGYEEHFLCTDHEHHWFWTP